MGDKMKHEVDLKNYTIRTDLALESIENNRIDKIKQEFETIEDIKVTTTYLDEKNGKKIDKKTLWQMPDDEFDKKYFDSLKKFQGATSNEKEKEIIGFVLNKPDPKTAKNFFSNSSLF